jgi:predicted nuclease with TOPRIM domain
LQLEQQEE